MHVNSNVTCSIIALLLQNFTQGESSMENWDVYDQHRNKTGKIITRGSEMAPDEFHVVVHVCIFNKQGEMLIQQRQPFKDGWPNLWDVSCGGSAITGDTSQQAAARELFEELGITYNFEAIRPQLTINFERGFDDYYTIEHEVNLSELVLQPEEVQAVKWASKDEIIQMMQEGTFIPFYEHFIHLLFDMRYQYGSIRE